MFFFSDDSKFDEPHFLRALESILDQKWQEKQVGYFFSETLNTLNSSIKGKAQITIYIFFTSCIIFENPLRSILKIGPFSKKIQDCLYYLGDCFTTSLSWLKII